MSATALFIFAKHPTPGDVMTRLCPPLTFEEAAVVQRACIRLICERAFRSWPVRPILVISPDDAEERFREFVGPFMPILPQGDGDLGERLARLVNAAFSEGAEQLLIIGADSPTLQERHIIEAQDRLKKSDAVIGPCDDGGFYLIGLTRSHENLFKDVEWGSDKVAQQTLERARGCGLVVDVMESHYDIDRWNDIERAAEDLRETNDLGAIELAKILNEVLRAAKSRST